MTCQHEGELRGWIELHELESGWAAHAYVRTQNSPECVAVCRDPEPAIEAALYELAAAVRENDELLA